VKGREQKGIEGLVVEPLPGSRQITALEQESELLPRQNTEGLIPEQLAARSYPQRVDRCTRNCSQRDPQDTGSESGVQPDSTSHQDVDLTAAIM
jgi:hypothetical protein